MIGDILKNIRKISKTTQKELGIKLNLAESSVSNYETGYSNPTFETVIKLASLCGFDLQFIDKQTGKKYTLEELSKEMDF